MTALAAPLPIRLARLVRIEHTVFALPFALIGALLARGGLPSWWQIGWILAAMVGARSAAMASWLSSRGRTNSIRPLLRGRRSALTRSGIPRARFTNASARK